MYYPYGNYGYNTRNYENSGGYIVALILVLFIILVIVSKND